MRELGGEIWTEVNYRIDEEGCDWRVKSELIDIVMGVLARHANKKLVNDSDLPVEPLEQKD